MLIMKPIELLGNKFMPYDSKNLVKPQKTIKISFKIQSRSQKKYERFFENEFFVHWASLDCKSGLSLTEPSGEK